MSGRILIAHEEVNARIMLKAQLMVQAYDVVLADSFEAIQQELAAQEVDALLLSGQVGSQDASKVIAQIRETPKGENLPIIVLEESAPRELRLTLLAAGADTVTGYSKNNTALQSRLRNLLRRASVDRDMSRDLAQSEVMSFAEFPALNPLSLGRITLIAPKSDIASKWRDALASQLRDRIVLVEPDHAMIEIGREPPPDAVVIVEDNAAPENARQLLAEFRSRRETMRSVAIVLQPDPDAECTSRLFDQEATDVLTGPFDAEEIALILRRELRRKAMGDQKRAALRNSLNMAVRDPLTGLYNRRYALCQLGHIVQNARRNGEEFAVMVLDLDRFKAINDGYGHATGDAVLVEVAHRLASRLRNEDFIARIGGEEFVAVVRNCDPVAAQAAAERLRSVVAEKDVKTEKGRVQVTTSIGLVVSHAPGVTLEASALIEQADRSLYDAKSAGRNTVNVFDSAA